jgi:hypothetical protein
VAAEPRGAEKIAAFPEDQCVAQLQPFQYRPKLRDPRVIVKRILQSKPSRKLQPDRKFRLRPPMACGYATWETPDPSAGYVFFQVSPENTLIAKIELAQQKVVETGNYDRTRLPMVGFSAA